MWSDILFDLDGTLTDSGPGIINSVKYALGKMGRPIPPDSALRRFVGPPLHLSFQRECGLSEQQSLDAVPIYREYFADKGIFENSLYPGAAEMLAALAAAGRRLHLATSKPLHFARRVLQHFEVMRFFATATGSGAGAEISEKDVIVRRALEEGGISPAGAVMVGDTHLDVEGAHQNGLPAVAVLYGYGEEAPLLAAGPEYTAEDMPRLQRLLLG